MVGLAATTAMEVTHLGVLCRQPRSTAQCCTIAWRQHLVETGRCEDWFRVRVLWLLAFTVDRLPLGSLVFTSVRVEDSGKGSGC